MIPKLVHIMTTKAKCGFCGEQRVSSLCGFQILVHYSQSSDILVQGELYNLPDGLTRPASITQKPTLPIPVWVPCAAYSVRQFQYAFFLELPIEILCAVFFKIETNWEFSLLDKINFNLI